MRVGPGLANAASSASLRPCTVSTSTAGTPNPSASRVHRIGGSLRSVKRRVAAPGAPTRCMASSSLRMAYTRLEHTTVTTSRRSRACVRDVRLGWRFFRVFCLSFRRFRGFRGFRVVLFGFTGSRYQVLNLLRVNGA